MFNRAKPITVKEPVLQTPESFKGGTFKSGFTGSYAPIIITSIVTFLITSFDLATDWMAFYSILHQRIDKRLDTQNENLYIALPRLFLAFCILASMIYAMDVIHFLYKFLSFRKQFFDTRDGINNEDFVIVKYSGEICVLLLVILEDLPISLLILAVQGVISCKCLMLIDYPVFYTCIVATCISIVWKLCQVIWSGGCCGKRENYNKSCSLLAFRIVTTVFIIVTLAVTILNSVLIKPDAFLHLIDKYSHGKSNKLFDKVYVEKWLDEEQIIFMQKPMPNIPTNSNDNPYPHDNLNPFMHFSNVVNFNKVLTGQNTTVKFSVPCSDGDMNMKNFLEEKDEYRIQKSGTICNAIFYFHYDPLVQKLFYDYGYRLTGGDGERCSQGRFRNSYTMQNRPDDDNRNEAATRQDESSPPPAETASLTESPTPNGMVIAHHIMLMTEMNDINYNQMYNPCDNVRLAYIVMDSFDACSDVLVEQ